MLTKNDIKLLKSLSRKKYRTKYRLFVAEGVTLVNDLLLSHYKTHRIYATNDYVPTNKNSNITRISSKELQKISRLKTPNMVVGVFKISPSKPITDTNLQVVLDEVKDPGNLGTIIRLCDWFGVTQLLCSTDSVDCYNPKVVQASMGSLARINISYLNVEEHLKKSTLPVYATAMRGENVYKQNLPKEALLIMGNEAKGVRKSLKKLSDKQLCIPNFSTGGNAESLNVAMATAIFLSEFRR